MNRKITVPHLIEVIAGAVILLFSFFHFYSYSGHGTSAWGSGLFPLATFVVLFGVIVAGQLALTDFFGVSLPPSVAGFSWHQIRLALSVFAVLQMFGFLIVDKGGLSLGVGAWFMFLGAIGLLVGVILEMTMKDQKMVTLGGSHTSSTPPPPPPPPPPAN